MATTIQQLRGTAAQIAAYTGLDGVITVNTTTDDIHVHDGVTPGGKGILDRAAVYTDINVAGRGGNPQHGYKKGISRLDTSAVGEPGSDNKFSYHRLWINDTASQVNGANGATGSKVDGLEVYHKFGGPSARGGRHALEGVLFQTTEFGATASDNADRFYVGTVGNVITQTGDGGTSVSDTRGAYFALHGIVQLLGGNRMANVTGAEINVNNLVSTATAVKYLSGIQIADFLASRGYEADAAIAISGLGGSPLGHKFGILFGAMNGRQPLDSDSTVLGFLTPTSLAAGIDLRNGSFSVAPFLAANMSLSGANLTMGAAGASIELGSTTIAGTPVLDFHSSGKAVDFDVRIAAVGGTTTAGQAGLAMTGLYFDLAAGGEFRVAGQKVLGARQGAIANHPSDGIVNAILTVLRIHGLIIT